MNTQVITRETRVIDAFSLENIKQQLNSLLQDNPKKIEAFKTRILKISLGYGMDKCSPESIINCGLQALTLELPLESGQGYIVNYGGNATFDCGYKGWQVLAKRAGYSVLADVVYACDEFRQEGFGFNREMIFNPNFSKRNSSDDKWAKDNLTGVIVSIKEDKTDGETHAFVPADMIYKIVGVSPSAGKTDKNGRMHSPHDKWAEQMFCAKAIKQILTKFPIDLASSTQLNEAIQITNATESKAQQSSAALQAGYPQERFDSLFHKWVEIVESGSKPAMTIITQLSNAYQLTSEQLEKVMTLQSHEPIDAEVSHAE